MGGNFTDAKDGVGTSTESEEEKVTIEGGVEAGAKDEGHAFVLGLLVADMWFSLGIRES